MFLRYVVTCRCGQALSGKRDKTYQAVACPDCGAGNFVLPLNPRAMPAGATRQPDALASATKPEPHADTAARSPVSGTDQRPPVARPTDHIAPDALRQDEPRDVSPPPASSPPTTDPDENVATPQSRRAEQRRQRITRSRLIVLAVVLLIGATLLITWRSALRTRYARDLERDTAAGYTALVAADFVAAERLLDQAHRAAVGLGNDTPAARRAVQLHQEALLWTSLLARPVDELLGALATANGRGGKDEAWREVFTQAYRGRNLIIATQIRLNDDAIELAASDAAASDDPAAPVRELYLNDWSLVGEGVEIRLSLGDLALLQRVPLEGSQDVILGGEIADLRPDAEQANVWWLTLVADSCTLITVAEPLVYYGWPADDTPDELLAQQYGWLEIEANDP